MTASINESQSNEGKVGFLRNHFKNAINNSNDIISGISSNISSRLSRFSTASSSSESPLQLDRESDQEEPPLPLHMLPGIIDSSPHSQLKIPVTMKEKIKEKFKFENLKPALEDLMLSSNSSETLSTLPTNTPESSKPGFRFSLNTINHSLPKKLEDYKALAIRTLSGDAGENIGIEKEEIFQSLEIDRKEKENLENGEQKDLDNESTGLSSKSLASIHSLHATGPDPFEKLKYKHDIASSGSISSVGVGHSTSCDSSDSDPHKKLWIRSGSQGSLQSWASSLSFDSQAEEVNDIREFMRSFVEDIFKNVHHITVDKKAEFGKLAQSEQGRLWFARCINAKRCCKCVPEVTFFSLIQHFAVMLFECAEADDFSPAKSLMNMCFTYYHEVTTPNGGNEKEFVYLFLRQQPIWKSLRFWNAAFFDALQCERAMRPVVTMETAGSNRLEALMDELHYQQNITFGQLGTFTCNMHAFGLSKEMVLEFLRKQVTIASLRDDQVKLLSENVQRMYSDKQEWL